MNSFLKQHAPNFLNSVADYLHKSPPDLPDREGDLVRHDDAEEIPRDEAQKISELIEAMKKIQARKESGEIDDASLAFVKGQLTILDTVPEYLRHGLFAQAGKSYDVIGRYANEPTDFEPDSQKVTRSIAVKVFSVMGERMGGGNDGPGAQDLIFYSEPTSEIKDVETALKLFKAAEGTSAKTESVGELPVMGQTFWTQTALRHGPYVAQYSLSPKDPSQETPEAIKLLTAADNETQRNLLANHLKSNSLVYTLRMQLCANLHHHPVEDNSIRWRESLAPYINLAELKFDPQESLNQERKIWCEKNLTMSTFVGLEEHRPLGGLNRARLRIHNANLKTQAKEKNLKVVDSAADMP